MKYIIPALVLFASLLLAGCAPKLNVSNMEESVKEMSQSLPDDQRQVFAASLTSLYMEKMGSSGAFAIAMSGNEKAADAALNKALEDLDGLTAKEIIKKADLSEDQIAKWQNKMRGF